MKKIIFVLSFTLLLFCTTWGFDGQRKGFVLGGGFGAGMTTYSFKQYVFPSGYTFTDRENKPAFMTDFKIGYAPTNQWEIVYSSKGSWFDGGDKGILNWFSTAAVSYYFKPEGRSFFVNGGLGLAMPVWGSGGSFGFGARSSSGLGFHVGGGYEFVQHWAIEIDLMYGPPKLSYWDFKDLVTVRGTVVATAF